MFDDDVDTLADPEMSKWKIPDLPLEFMGDKGAVVFRSLEELSGAHLERLRDKVGEAKNDGSASNVYYDEALRMLITRWDVPGQPQLAIPKGDPRALKSLPAVVRRKIERHIRPYMDRLMSEKQDDEDDATP